MSRSPHTSSHSSDNYSESSSSSSTRSIIKPATPGTASPTSHSLAVAEAEGVYRGRQDAGWKTTSGKTMSDTVHDLPPPRYPSKATGAKYTRASTQGSASEDSGTGEAVVLRCTQFVRTGACAYGNECKYSHASIPLSQSEKTTKYHKQHDSYTTYATKAKGEAKGTPAYSAEMPREDKRAIDHLLRKTKMCHAFNKGKCDYGYACRFAHIAGQDAFQILSKANADKNCPFQLVLGTCSTKGKGCYFKHSPIKRNTTHSGKGKNTKTSTKAHLQQMHAEGGRTSSGGSEGSVRSVRSQQDEDEFAREINDLIDFREGLKDVHVSSE